ncbi:O-antigen ligase family protein [Saccharothrix obliqua]|uniref:O-antigen ligase family protein n=1 Tax=Saccharothrix obliqua TaxID=2861747 RepID=UPI001C5F240C|nr:O-antigen ligase family protein [Saccharothrix obliqua]MBW4716303.1 O-antigen ligase family protein [Saccharothrix obliqua]
MGGSTGVARAVPRQGDALPLPLLVLLAALSAAVVAQGGYHLPGRVLAASVTGLALLLALRTRPRLTPVMAACAALALWAVVRGTASGTPWATVAAVGVFAAAAYVAERSDARQRELCASVLIGIGTLAALTGWAAVVWRIPSWSTVAEGLTRASSTLTYPNALAALCAATAVLAVARPSAPHTAAASVLMTGLGATLSRAGALALLVGLVVLGLLGSWRRIAPPVLGAAVAVAALSPSFPVGPPSPVVAVAGLVAGVAVAVGAARLPRSAAVVLVVGAASFAAFAGRLGGRWSLSSPDRTGAAGAALDLVRANPLFGVGPGNGWFTFLRDGHSRVMRYAHDEYLQVLVELGAIGLALLGCVLFAVFRAVRRRTGGPWAGAVAALAVLAVHSGFDFLWHLPVTLLVAGVCTGLATPVHTSEEHP